MLTLNFKGLFFIVALALFIPLADAAEYPNKTIQIINPFPPGAVTDIVARIVAPKMSTALGQQVVVVKRPAAAARSEFKPPRMPRRTVIRFSSRRRQFCSFPSSTKIPVLQ